MINMPFPSSPGPIGVFDSGYGGLTILHGIRQLLPQYDYMYLGDNARAPYGSRSFEVVYQFTRQAVLKLFSMGCHLVILGCNTASAKALRSIQQRDLPMLDPDRRVLGVIRPTAEEVGNLTKTRHVGILATEGTIKSNSYIDDAQRVRLGHAARRHAGQARRHRRGARKPCADRTETRRHWGQPIRPEIEKMLRAIRPATFHRAMSTN